MSTFETGLLTLIDQYATAYAVAQNSGSHTLDKSRSMESVKYLYGLIEAKVGGHEPPFKCGDVVENIRYAEADGRNIRLSRIGEKHRISRMVYQGGWCIEIELFGGDEQFCARDFKKAQ